MTAKLFDEAPRRRVIAPGERYKNAVHFIHGILPWATVELRLSQILRS
jgi:hypothetical protein